VLGHEKTVFMLNAGCRRVRGFTLLELLIGIAVVGVVMAMGLPSMTTFIRNTQVRNAGDSILAGLQLARAEALRRNAVVRFQLTSSTAAGCALSASGLNWVVSLDDATGSCGVAPSETNAPRIIQVWTGASETASAGGSTAPKAVIAATGGTTLQFNGIGRLVGTGITQIAITNPVAGACQPGGIIRCLTIIVGTSGQARMCDPAVTDAADPRKC
jgi:type IV fimbrial biogenesis protein FimT